MKVITEGEIKNGHVYERNQLWVKTCIAIVYLQITGLFYYRDFLQLEESDGKQTKTPNNININQRMFDKRKT